MNHGWQIAIVLVSAFLAFEPSYAVSSVYVEIRAGASQSDNQSGETTVDQSPNNNAFSQSDPVLGVDVSHIESRAVGGANAFGSGSAISNPGGVHVAANVSAAANASASTQGHGSVNTDAQAAMGDTFTLLVPGLPLGTPITVTASWYTSGNLFASFVEGPDDPASPSAYSAWSADFAFLPVGVEGFRARRSAGCQHDSVALACWGDDFDTQPAVVTFGNGAAVTVSISARARAWGDAVRGVPGTASINAFADLGNTVGWGGIASVQDAGGNDLPEYSALSADTGYDYRFAYVPEPQTPALFAAAVAALFLVSKLRAA